MAFPARHGGQHDVTDTILNGVKDLMHPDHGTISGFTPFLNEDTPVSGLLIKSGTVSKFTPRNIIVYEYSKTDFSCIIPCRSHGHSLQLQLRDREE